MDRSAVPCGPLRSCVPRTAGNTREQPSTRPSVFAGFPACSRVFALPTKIGEKGSLWLYCAVFEGSAVFLRAQVTVRPLGFTCRREIDNGAMASRDRRPRPALD
jgi:hypothetical protein